MLPPQISRKMPALLAAGAALAIWLLAMWFYLLRKSSFFDDTFIYLHIANNIIETGSASYFPLSGSGALLASSPLRLLTLVPAALVARLAVDPDRSIAAATLTMYLSGLVASVVYLPFYSRDMRRWLVGLVGAGLVCLSSETGLQMEGALLFWAAFTTLHVLRPGPRDRAFLSRLGAVSALLFLTRPEYGVVGAVVVGSYVVLRGRRSGSIGAFVFPLLTAALAWAGITLWLGVYPVPTSYISKALTLRAALFSGSTLGEWLPVRLRAIFALGQLHWLGMAVYFAAVLAALFTLPVRFRWATGCLMAVLTLLWRAPGLYIWYFENLSIVLLSISLSALLDQSAALARTQDPWRWRLAAARLVLIATPILFFLEAGFLRDRHMFWDFRAQRSRGLAYRAIGKASVGHGRFRFDDRTGYLMMSEIGIPAYFAGNDTWLWDRGGLAQPGEIQGIAEHPLARVYPRGLFRTAIEELTMMYTAYEQPEPGDEVAIFFARGNPADVDIPVMCDRYYPETAVCLKYLQSMVRADSTDTQPETPAPR